MGWVLLVFGMEFPGIVALTDCYQRAPERFAGGERDKGAWFRWLVVALFLMPIGVGYGILLGYHWNVIKRQPFADPIVEDDE
ncbi:MAG TPA: hypothetical protein VHC63_01410 [Acidimicrobiales bacterium]|nr:hypothetical protein [Acidimicrobiales bacterium]